MHVPFLYSLLTIRSIFLTFDNLIGKTVTLVTSDFHATKFTGQFLILVFLDYWTLNSWILLEAISSLGFHYTLRFSSFSSCLASPFQLISLILMSRSFQGSVLGLLFLPFYTLFMGELFQFRDLGCHLYTDSKWLCISSLDVNRIPKLFVVTISHQTQRVQKHTRSHSCSDGVSYLISCSFAKFFKPEAWK